MPPMHPIKVVAERTGLSPHVIRAWEKRYGAVTPSRTGTNRRLYSDAEVERLALLRRLAEAGQGIGQIAALPIETLRELAESHRATPRVPPVRPGSADLLSAAMAAVRALDSRALGQVLEQGELELGAHGVLQRLVAPLSETIGELWRDGTITAAHEHFATAVIRLFLGHAAKPFAATRNAPVLVVGTPTGQLHELGALMAGATAANLGWHVVYLGASLGAAEIAGAARQHHARAVALSLVYPLDDENVSAELARLRGLLPDTPVLIGGRATPHYRGSLEGAQVTAVADLSELGRALDEIRAKSTA